MALFGSASGEQELTIVIRARNEAERVLKQAEDAVKNFKKDNKEMLADVAKASAVASAAFLAFGGAAVKAASDAEVQIAKFNTILKNSAGANDEVRKSILKNADAAKQLGFDNEAAAVSIAGLFQRTGDLNKSLELNGFAMDLARAKNISLEDATRAVQMVLSGNARVLKEYGIELDETKAPIEALAEAQQKLRGSAEGFSQTFQGQLQVFQQEFGDLMEEIGTAFLPALTNLVRAITPVIKAVTDWTKENPRLTSTILLVGGGVSVLVTAASGLISVLPKVISGIRLLMLALSTGLGAALGAVVIAIGYVIAKFAAFADEVGGFKQAWDLWMIEMARMVWSWAGAVVDAVDYVADYIPFLGNVLDSTSAGIQARVAELDAGFNALAMNGFGGLEKSAGSMGEGASKAFTQVSKSAEEAAEKVKSANKEIEETEKRIADLKSAYLGDLVDAKTEYARAFVEQEQKIADIRAELSRTEDDEQRQQLRNQLERETQALEERRVLEQLLGAEVNEERRRAGLTDFAREVEDIQKRVLAKTNEFNSKMVLLQKELAENQRKRDSLIQMEGQVTTAVVAEVKKRETETVASIQTTINKYNELASAASRASGSTFKVTSTIGGMQTTTPAFIPKKAFGGLVPGPEGTPVPIIAHGQERIIPARTAAMGGGSADGGASYTVIIQNPPAELQNTEWYRMQIEKALRDVSRVHKLTTV